MPEFYYTLRGKNADNNWCFPPLWTDKIEAKDRKEAAILIGQLYERDFPTRVLKKDIESNNFLLTIKEIGEKDNHTRSLFDSRCCENCGREYRVIEKYQITGSGGGFGFCSSDCRDEKRELIQAKQIHDANNYSGIKYSAIIYKITNKETGKCYIGKTNQIFTLRWYQHFYHRTESKFHKEIGSYPLIAWSFEIIEIIDVPLEITTLKGIEDYTFKREMFWIEKYDCINNGYNSVVNKHQE